MPYVLHFSICILGFFLIGLQLGLHCLAPAEDDIKYKSLFFDERVALAVREYLNTEMWHASSKEVPIEELRLERVASERHGVFMFDMSHCLSLVFPNRVILEALRQQRKKSLPH